MKKSMWKKVTALAVGAVMLLSLAACGSPKTLEEYISKNEDTKKEIENIGKESGGTVEVKGNTITVTLKLDMEIDDSMKEAFEEAMLDGIEEEGKGFADDIKGIEKEVDIKGIELVLKITDSSDKEVLSVKFNNTGYVK